LEKAARWKAKQGKELLLVFQPVAKLLLLGLKCEKRMFG